MPQAVWYLKCRALTLKNWIDDTEIEEEVRTQPCVCPWQHLTHDPVLWLSCHDGNYGMCGLDCCMLCMLSSMQLPQRKANQRRKATDLGSCPAQLRSLQV